MDTLLNPLHFLEERMKKEEKGRKKKREMRLLLICVGWIRPWIWSKLKILLLAWKVHPVKRDYTKHIIFWNTNKTNNYTLQPDHLLSRNHQVSIAQPFFFTIIWSLVKAKLAAQSNSTLTESNFTSTSRLNKNVFVLTRPIYTSGPD